ncbi:MAG: hypothetical protein IJI33_00045 [Solobacterium sp.]|nr:hypothetical protein [Solobacterium sp.]
METLEITMTPEIAETVSEYAEKEGISIESAIRMLLIKGLEINSDLSRK